MSTTIKKPATDFIQTSRTGWITSMTIEEIIQVLPLPDLAGLPLFELTNRPINEKHAAGITKYLQETPNWAMPSIILAASPDQIKSKDGQIEISTGELKILDGQHRIKALSDFKHQIASKDESKANEMLQSELPVVIFEVKDVEDHRQMFAWFARNRPIEAPVREHFDNSDPFNNAAKAAEKKSSTLNGRVNFEKGKIETRDPNIITLTSLKEIATVIQIGIQRTANETNRQECRQDDNQANLQDKLIEFFDEFLPECQHNYDLLADLEKLDTKLIYERNATFAFDAQMIRLIANVWARWAHNYNRPPEKLTQYVGKIDMLKTSPTNNLEEPFRVINSETKKYERPRDKSWEKATEIILTAAQQ